MKSIANTTIRFGLISLPSQVCAATETADDVSFESAGPNGERLRQTYVDDEGNEVPRDTWLKGVWNGDEFTPVPKESIDEIAKATKLPDLGIIDVIDRDMIPSERITGKYFIQSAAKGGNINSFKLFVEALHAENLAVVTKWTARSRQKLMVMVPDQGNLVGYTLAFNDNMRLPDESVEAHHAGVYSDAEFDMARQLLSTMRSEGEGTALAEEVDEAITLKADLYQQALAGKPVKAPKVAEAPEANNDLTDALGAMLAQAAAEKAKRAEKATA